MTASTVARHRASSRRTATSAAQSASSPVPAPLSSAGSTLSPAGMVGAAERASSPSAAEVGSSASPSVVEVAAAQSAVSPSEAEAAAESKAAASGTGGASGAGGASGSLRHYLGVTVSAAVLILVLALAVVTIALPAVVGGRPFTVLTQSMEPGLPPGTLIVTHPVAAADIRIGDVLTYQMHSGEPAVISHRVIEKSVAGDGTVTFVTQGDNNDLPDESPVREVQVVGTLWYSIPLLGWVNTAINGDARAVLVPVAVALLFGYAAWMLVSGVRDRMRARTRRERSQDR